MAPADRGDDVMPPWVDYSSHRAQGAGVVCFGRLRRSGIGQAVAPTNGGVLAGRMIAQ